MGNTNHQPQQREAGAGWPTWGLPAAGRCSLLLTIKNLRPGTQSVMAGMCLSSDHRSETP